MKKIISIILVLSLLLSFGAFMSGCGDDRSTASKTVTSSEDDNNVNSKPSDSTNSVSSEQAVSEVINSIDSQTGSKTDDAPKINLFNGDEANFIIIRSNTADNDTVSAASYFYKAISDTHGISVNYKNDSVARDKNQLEISIGVTNRPKASKYNDEIKKAHANYGMDYSIIFDDNIIYIVGGTGTALMNGVKAFLAYFCSTTTGAIATNFEYRYHINEGTGCFAIDGKSDLSAYKIIVPKYNMSYLIGREVNTLSEELMYATGSIVPRTPDSEKESKYEIVISNANRSNIPMPSNTDEYILRMTGNKLYVIGGSDGATAMAVKLLISWVKDGKHLPNTLEYTGSYDYDISNASDEDYKLVWNDEFDTSIDTSIWYVANGLYSTSSNDNIAPRKKMFTNSSNNLKIEDGKLVMKGSYDDDYYYGIEMRTFNSLWLKYGIIEISCKMNFSKGICPAFWLLANSSQKIAGEFDMFEGLGEYGKSHNAIKCTTITHPSDETGYRAGTLYCGAVNSVEETFYPLEANTTWDNDYHTIGCEWTPTSLKYVIDGDVFLDIDTTQDELSYYTHNGLMHIILTLYTGNDVCTPYTGVPDSTTNWKDNNFTIDYIRLYQNADGILQN